jgi:cell division protein FtsB
MTLFLLFNEFGLLKYLKLKKEVSTITNEINKVKEKNQALKNEVDSLERKVPAKIEKVAREKYGMIRPGEKTIEINQK